MGYHLRRCSSCNRWRLLKRADRNHTHPADLTAEQLTKHFNRKIAKEKERSYAASGGRDMAFNSSAGSQAVGTAPHGSSVTVVEATGEDGDYRSCPKCGAETFRRSRRRWYERMLKRSKMARCLKCQYRFPYPLDGD